MTDESDRQDFDRELEELNPDDTWLMESEDGTVYDWAKLHPLLAQMIDTWAAAFPQQAEKLYSRQPGLDMRHVEGAPGVFEVYSPPRTEEQEPLVIGRFHLDLLRADVP
jgi:hypothetical protein